jgi:hypothetical protein
MRLLLSVIATSAVLIGHASVADAEPVNADRCFSISRFQTWKAIDDHTMYIRVNRNQYYRLDMAGRCAMLTRPGAHLITYWRGTSSVCSSLDWDLRVSQGVPGGITEPCIVKTMTPLTAAQANAIPKKFRP